MCVPNFGSDYRAYGHSDPYCYPDADRHSNSDPDSNGHVDPVMAVSEPTAGPRFSDLTAQSEPEGTPGMAPPAPTGGVMTNDASMEAILTSPLQQARVRAQMSQDRLKKLALQMKQARDAF